MEASASLKRGGSPLQQENKYFRSSGESESSDSDIDSDNENDRTVIDGEWGTVSKQKIRKSTKQSTDFPLFLEDIGSDSDPKFRSYGQFTSGLFKSAEISDVSHQKRLSANKWIIHLRSEESQIKLLNIRNLGGVKIKCEIPQRSAVGVVKPVPIGVSMEQIKSSCSKVKDAFRLKRKDGAESNAIKLVFTTNELPNEIQIGYEFMSVHVFVDPVIRCSRCQRLGHRKVACKFKDHICPRCGKQAHDPANPENNIKLCQEQENKRYCVNCKSEGHSAAWKGCPMQKNQKKSNFESAKYGIPKAVLRHNPNLVTNNKAHSHHLNASSQASSMTIPGNENSNNSSFVKPGVAYADKVKGESNGQQPLSSNSDNVMLKNISDMFDSFEKKIDEKLKNFEARFIANEAKKYEHIVTLHASTEKSKEQNPIKHLIVNFVKDLFLASKGNTRPLIQSMINLLPENRMSGASSDNLQSFSWDSDLNDLMQTILYDNSCS